MSLERHFSRICASLHISWDFQLQEEYTRWEAVSPDSAEKIPMFHADFPGFTLKIVEHSPYLLDTAPSLTDIPQPFPEVCRVTKLHKQAGETIHIGDLLVTLEAIDAAQNEA
jgi:hypothetical protein